ncbi:hypothetical protein O181_037152 [Austropuccinia psidii MF-1]|uniref:Uncharacterized protein n=1 Tax=Austropuccinia psidii MF-1 TaxID=1389203 RepID=A0A9Q3D8G0_9BASI|nr:hypothetical protein [Austropuccinia psidii MF-1]
MKPQPQCHVLDNPYHQGDIKTDAFLENKERSPSQYQDGDNMSYSEKESFKQLPEASNWPKFSWTGEYDHISNTEFKGHASIWYIEEKEIHARRKWPWWKSQIIQEYSNGTWIWHKTMSFENDKYSVDKDPYEWCLRQSRRLKAIDPQMDIQMRNHKLLIQMPGELEHAVKCRSNQIFNLDDIVKTLQDVRKRTNIGKYSP